MSTRGFTGGVVVMGSLERADTRVVGGVGCGQAAGDTSPVCLRVSPALPNADRSRTHEEIDRHTVYGGFETR